MTDIPEDTVTLQDVAQWFTMKQELGKLKSAEALLRGRIFKFFFRDPKEGTNDHDINDGTGAVLKGGYVINRSVDPGAFAALREAQKADPNSPPINLDALVAYKPELVLSEYRKLTEEERNWFDQALIIKPGSPSLDVVIPKRVK